MALQINKKLNNGVEISYWRIVRINNLVKNGTEVILGGYLNKQESDNGSDLMDTHTFSFVIPKDDFVNGNVFETAYTLIKASQLDEEGNETNIFANAEDC